MTLTKKKKKNNSPYIIAFSVIDRMQRSRFTETQIISILSEAEAGLSVKEVSRKQGISEETYYNWKSKYGGMSAN